MKRTLERAALALLLLLVRSAAAEDAAPAAAATASVEIAGPIAGAALLCPGPQRRGEGGGSSLLVVARSTGLSVVDWRRAPLAESRAELPLGARRALAWCVAGPGSGGGERIFALVDSGELLEWAGTAEPPRVVLKDTRLHLPAGVYPMRFARDLDGDGDVDFALPKNDGFQIWLAEREGVVAGPAVHHRIDTDVDYPGPAEVGAELEQSVRVPAFDVADQNGDGRLDLVFSDGDLVQFYWSRPDGTLPREPTFELDLEAIRDKLPPQRRDLIDTSNLLSLLEGQVSHVERDIDGDRVTDLMVRQGKKVSLYRGAPAGVDRSRATRVFLMSGNLLAAFVADDDGDGREDLCMLTVSDVSLGQVLLWLVAGGEVTFELRVFRQEGAFEFAKKASRERSLVLDVPSATRLVGDFEERIDGWLDEFSRVPAAADLDGDGVADDVVDLGADGAIRLFLDADPGRELDERASAWLDVMRRYDAEADGAGKIEIDLNRMIDWLPLPGRGLRQLVRDREPTATIAGAPRAAGDGGEQQPALFVADLDGNARADFVVAARARAGAPLVLTFFAR